MAEKETVIIDIEINEEDAIKSTSSLEKSINKLTESIVESNKAQEDSKKRGKKKEEQDKKSKSATDSLTESVTRYAKKLGPAALAVGALVAIGKGLIESLKTNKEFMDALAVETAALSGVMDKLKADIGNATLEMLGFNDSLDESGERIGFVESALAVLSIGFANAGFISLASYTGGLIAVAKAAGDVEAFQIALKDELAAYNLEVGKLNLKYEEQIAKTRELDQTTQQQIDTLTAAQGTFEEIAKVTEERIELEVALQKASLAAADGTVLQKREEDKLNEVLLKQAQTMKGLSARRRELLNRQKEATNRLVSEEKAHKTFISTLEKENREIDKLIANVGLLADVTVQSEESKISAFDKSLAKTLSASNKRIAKSQEEVDNAVEGESAKKEAVEAGFSAVSEILGSLKGLNIENAALNKGIAIAETIVNTAAGVVKMLNSGLPVPANFIAAGTVGAIGAAQLGIIAGTEFADGGLLKGNSHDKGGININAEGGEAVINKRSMANPILRSIASDINAAGGGKRFALGGIVGSVTPSLDASLSGLSSEFSRAIQNQPPVLVLEDLSVTQNRVNVVEDRASLRQS